MEEQLALLIEKLKSDRRISSFDEAATKQTIVLRILSILGWDQYDIDMVRPEYSVGSKRVDYSLRINDSNKVFIEVKKVGLELISHQQQLLDYSFQEGIELAVLTNGVTWWFYLPLQKGNWEQRKFYSIDIREQKSEDVALKFMDFLSRKNVASGEAEENAKKVKAANQKQLRVKETLPKAWNKIVNEPDKLLVGLINNTIEELCGYRADEQLILKFIKNQFQLSDSNHPKKRERFVQPDSMSYSGSLEEILVSVPPAYVKFGGFSAKNVKEHFPKKEGRDNSFIINFFDKEEVEAYNSQNRIKIVNGSKLFEKYGVDENSKLKIQVIEKFRCYKIVEII